MNYELAEIITRNLMSADADAFRMLLRNADAADGGRAALAEIYAVNLEDLAAAFLEQDV